jgi:hypothetical protein
MILKRGEVITPLCQRIIALDPGTATGVSELDFLDNTTSRVMLTHTYDFESLVGYLSKKLTQKNCDTLVIVERFVITKKSHVTDSLEAIGIARGLAYLHGHRFLVQNVSSAKLLVTNDMLRALHVYGKGNERRHENDATRHLIHYLVSTDKAFAKAVIEELEAVK